jgi:sugar/nucleoside kinase (ribokinase family)
MKQRVFRVLKDLPGKKKEDYITAYHSITNASWFDENNLTISANLENKDNFEEILPHYPPKPEPDFKLTMFAHSANEVVISDEGLRKLARGLTLETSDLIIKMAPKPILGMNDEDYKKRVQRSIEEFDRELKDPVMKTAGYIFPSEEELKVIHAMRNAKQAGRKIQGIIVTKQGLLVVESGGSYMSNPLRELFRVGSAGEMGDVYMAGVDYFLVKHIGQQS